MPLAWTIPDPKPKDIARTIRYVDDISGVIEAASAQVEGVTYKKLASTMIEVRTLFQRKKKAETEFYAEFAEDN